MLYLLEKDIKMEQKAELKHLIAAPLMGLAFAIFLPAIGLIMAVSLLGKKVFSTIHNYFSKLCAFNWRPLEAYLLGRKSRKTKSEIKDE